jgi:hypothetical protein
MSQIPTRAAELGISQFVLCSKQLELLGEGGLQNAGVLRLSFAHHVHHLDATQDHTGSCRGF